MKKIVAFLALAALLSTSAFANISGNAEFIYDAAGNPIGSTTGALNEFITNSSLAVTQSGTWTVQQGTPPWSVSQSGSWTVTANAGTGEFATNLNQVGGASFALGQQNMAGSLPVTIASNQSPVPVTISSGAAATYAVNIVGLSPASSPTDIITISGSGTKTVKVLDVRIFGSSSGGASAEFDLVKRSAADTGGTSATATPTQYNSGDAAATAVVKSYTANPSALGTSQGILDAELFFVPKVLGLLFDQKFDGSSTSSGEGIVLNGASEFLAINMGGVTVSGASLSARIVWIEQ